MTMTTPDLNAFAAQLGDPSDWFVDSDGRAEPLVVRHSTGEAVYTLRGGSLVPVGVPREGFASGPSGFALSIVCTPPDPTARGPHDV